MEGLSDCQVGLGYSKSSLFIGKKRKKIPLRDRM